MGLLVFLLLLVALSVLLLSFSFVINSKISFPSQSKLHLTIGVFLYNIDKTLYIKSFIFQSKVIYTLIK